MIASHTNGVVLWCRMSAVLRVRHLNQRVPFYMHPYICVEEGELLAIRALLDVGEDSAGVATKIERRELLRG